MKMTVFWFALAVQLLVVKPAALMPTTVTIPGLGDITGNVRAGCNEYLGIKYAEAPRFEDPQNVNPWPPTYDATSRGPMCYQDCPSIPEQICQPQISEDCLYLNIFTPLGNPHGCVMVFFHGGNFLSYSGGSLLYDGEAFVQKGGCILVTINYRLGALGFLGSRNLGLKDQIKALEWISNYIVHFGGDNTKITAFGQSAGAQSIGVLMSVASASQYFQRVILQSCPVTLPFRSLQEGTSQEAQLAALMGCAVGNLTCYQEADADDILTWQTSVIPGAYFLLGFEPWGPVIDGGLVQNHLYEIFTQGLHQPMEMIIGTLGNEGEPYIYPLFPNPLSQAELNAFLAQISPGLSHNQLALFYPITDPSDTRDVLSALTTDFIFNCVSRDVASIVSESKRVYLYEYCEVFPDDVWGPGNICNDLCCHGIELPLVFGSYVLGGYTLSSSQQKLSDDIIKYWTNFAKNGNPYRWRQGLARWWPSGTMVLEAGNTGQKNFFSLLATLFKCSTLKSLLNFQPFK